ncbi:isocitrate dehydrogenase (NADP(+)), partial [Thermus scotoductus]
MQDASRRSRRGGRASFCSPAPYPEPRGPRPLAFPYPPLPLPTPHPPHGLSLPPPPTGPAPSNTPPP